MCGGRDDGARKRSILASFFFAVPLRLSPERISSVAAAKRTESKAEGEKTLQQEKKPRRRKRNPPKKREREGGEGEGGRLAAGKLFHKYFIRLLFPAKSDVHLPSIDFIWAK